MLNCRIVYFTQGGADTGSKLVARVRGLRLSAVEFVRRVFRRWYLVLVGAIGGIVWVAQLAGVELKVPSWLPLAAIFGSLLLAIFWSFHDLRIERDRSHASAQGHADSRYDALSDLLGRSLAIGAKLSEDRERIPLDAWQDHTRALITTAYGEGEAAHIFTRKARVNPPKVETGPHAMFGALLRGTTQPLGEVINHLRDLLGRMNLMTIRSAFNPADWQVFDPAAYKAEHALAIRTEGDAELNCPWCGRGIDDYPKQCVGCSAEFEDDLAYRTTAPAIQSVFFNA